MKPFTLPEFNVPVGVELEPTMTDAERAEHYRQALERITTPEAFYVAAGSIDPEAFGRMIYAQYILDGMTLKAAEEKAEFETHRRYPLRRTTP